MKNEFYKTFPKISKQNSRCSFFGDYGKIDLGFSLIEENTVGPFEHKLHLHQTGQEYYWTLEGEGILEVEGESVRLHPKEMVMVAPGAKHRINEVKHVPFKVAVICTVKQKDGKVVLE